MIVLRGQYIKTSRSPTARFYIRVLCFEATVRLQNMLAHAVHQGFHILLHLNRRLAETALAVVLAAVTQPVAVVSETAGRFKGQRA